MKSGSIAGLTEEELIRSLKDGDIHAFTKLYDLYWDWLYNFAVGVMKDEVLAQDVIHDVFMVLWGRHNRIAIQSSLKDYLFICTKNRCFKLLHKLRRCNEVERNLCSESVYEYDELSYRELSDQVDHIIADLPDKSKAIFVMSREEGLSYRQIADRMNLSIKSVEYHISKVLNKLRKALFTG